MLEMGNKKKTGKKAVIYCGLLLILGGLVFAVFGALYEARYLTTGGADSTTFTTGGIGDAAPELVEAAEYRENLAALEKTCADLTKDDPDGRVYEPIVGRYLGSKSYASGSPSGVSSTWHSLNMVIAMNDVEVKVYVGADREEFSDLMVQVTKIIGKKYMNWPDSEDTNFQIGLCTYKNNSKNYNGSVKTLVKVGSK